MSDAQRNLEIKLEHDSGTYRLNKLLELLLHADMRRLDEIYSKNLKDRGAKENN